MTDNETVYSLYHDLDPDCAAALACYALTTKKTNDDEWMVGLVNLANGMFLASGKNERLRYYKGKIERIDFKENPRKYTPQYEPKKRRVNAF